MLRRAQRSDAGRNGQRCDERGTDNGSSAEVLHRKPRFREGPGRPPERLTARSARRFAAHAATLAYQVPDGLRGVSGGGSANVSARPLFVLDTRFCSRASIAVSRLPVFAQRLPCNSKRCTQPYSRSRMPYRNPLCGIFLINVLRPVWTNLARSVREEQPLRPVTYLPIRSPNSRAASRQPKTYFR